MNPVNRSDSFAGPINEARTASTAGGGTALSTTEPDAGAAGTGRLYFDHTDSGHTRLMVKFSTGTPQQLAIQL